MHDEPPFATSVLWLQEHDEWISVRVQISRPTESSDSRWLVRVNLVIGEEEHVHQAMGGDSMQALLSGLIATAVEVHKLRERGKIHYLGRSDDYFCLDELLRTPATKGHLPAGGEEVRRADAPPRS
ncbi:MAG: hypothetical protein IT303_08500 [Dehalococcoidia bacterium]|nr:hypothetical protein [Dehalococcoidia bacterium]